jgi:hypothetical protein
VSVILIMLSVAAAASSNEFEEYRSCILRNAQRLEASAEMAQVVADASVTACRALKRKFVADYVNDPKRRGYMSVVEAGRAMTELLNGTAVSAHAEAVLQVMETRTARNGGANSQ